MAGHIGVLAYGSLIDNPGEELAQAESERRSGLRTPFRVEFARSSRGRGGAPTLVPVTVGGDHVEATVIMLRSGISLADARDIVYRREIDKVGELSYRYHPDPKKKEQVYVESLQSFADTEWVLYTRIEANIQGASPDELADLAIASAAGPAGVERRDGISYLRSALANGVRTPLSGAYRDAILKATKSKSLEDAWKAARQGTS